MKRRKPSKPSTNNDAVIDRVNATPLTPEQMLSLAEKVGGLEPGDRGFEGHVFAVVSYFQDEKRKFDLTASAMFRFEALARIIMDGSLPGWTKDGKAGDGGVLTHEALLIAAGQCPVVARKNQVHFPKKDLLRLVFQVAKKGATA